MSKRVMYLVNPCRLRRKDNTVFVYPTDGTRMRPLPIQGLEELFCMTEVDINTKLLNFFGQRGVAVHFFDYYENYTGSFFPRSALKAGRLLVSQAGAYSDTKKRMRLAQSFVTGGAFNMLKVLRYYEKRKEGISDSISRMESFAENIPEASDIPELMGLEGNIRQAYYSTFDLIINDYQMGTRQKRQPNNEVNALISFCNMLCYASVLRQIRHTALDPTISYLHEPGERRFSLALDLAEIFKPILSDRLVFTLLNKRQIGKNDFQKDLNNCVLKEKGGKTVLRAWDGRMNETIKHRSLNRNVSYKQLIRMECHKLTKDLSGISTYKPFKSWW